MLCCALLAMMLALPLELARRLRPRTSLFAMDPLAWRPERETPAAPPQARRFTLGARAASFRHAGRGLLVLCRSEHNAWLHLAAAGSVAVAGLVLQVSAADWRWLVVAIALVLAAEALNTAIERVCDRLTRDHCPLIRDAKDIAAGAVLLLALAAALIGLLTILPYLHASVQPIAVGWPICLST